MAHTNVALNFNAFLEKTKVKDGLGEDHPHSHQESICPGCTAR